MEEQPPLRADKSLSDARLDRLGHTQGVDRAFNARHSAFIRRMKILLPLAAICIIAVLMSWQRFQSDNLAPQTADENTADIQRNELLNPRFDSVDEKGQAYIITADKATQTDTDKDVMLLEKPFGDITLNNGNWLAISALNGSYNQVAGQLLLNENVTLYHDDGYRLRVEQLELDLNKQIAWSDTSVQAQGPRAVLDAKGLNANTETETLTFKGPAKLILYDVKGAL